MSDWKDNIEAQIAWLAMEPWARTQDCAQVMRDLLDVAVAAHKVNDNFYSHEPDYYQVHHSLGDALEDALDKLREVGGE